MQASRRSRRTLWALLLVLAAAASAFVGQAIAGLSNRYDWDCGTWPAMTACPGLSNALISEVDAVNVANGYSKCAKITRTSDGVIYSRQCYSAYAVVAFNSDYGYMSYPNYSIHMDAAVGNNDWVPHGLRGFAIY